LQLQHQQKVLMSVALSTLVVSSNYSMLGVKKEVFLSGISEPTSIRGRAITPKPT
jgi:hypothetical protein